MHELRANSGFDSPLVRIARMFFGIGLSCGLNRGRGLATILLYGVSA